MLILGSKSLNRISLPVSKIICFYFLFLGLSNLFVSLFFEPFFEAPSIYVAYIFSSLALLFFYKKLKDVYWDFEKYSSLVAFLYYFGFASFVFIVFLYVLQGSPDLISFRTDNQHSYGFLWLFMNIGLLLSPFGNKNRSLLFTSLVLIGVFLTGSRLYIAIYFVFNMAIYNVSFRSVKAWLLGGGVIVLSAVLAIVRESSGGGKINLDGIQFYFLDLIERNVALWNGINLFKKECVYQIEVGNPLLLLIPRAFYDDKPLVFNVQAFMCFYNKTEVPAKSSGFFVAEHFILYSQVAPFALFLNCVFYGAILSYAYNRCSNLFKLLLVPLLLLSVFGPIDGLFSSSFQLALLIVGVYFFYELLPKKAKH